MWGAAAPAILVGMPLVLLLAFIVVPIIELAVIIQVGQVIGTPATVALLLVVSVAGAWLVKREGLKAWSRFRAALAEARIPAEEVVDGALVMLAGALMLTPGFVTDAAGLLLVIPPSRALISRLIRARVRLTVLTGPVRRGHVPRSSQVRRPDPPVEVEVVDIKRSQRPH